MPNPKTIEELLNMKPCPFEDGEEITKVKLAYLLTYTPHVHSLAKAVSYAFEHNQPFKIPDGYFHLPPDKQLGLPLGEWTFAELMPLINILPYGILMRYVWNERIAINVTDHVRLKHLDFSTGDTVFNILKQPPNLYNPLDHKEEVLMQNSSANEAQPAKETEKIDGDIVCNECLAEAEEAQADETN